MASAVEKSIRPEPRAQMQEPRTTAGVDFSPRPLDRPTQEELADRAFKRETSKAFGDTEFRYDLDKALENDPIGLLGFDPKKGKLRKTNSENAFYYRANNSQATVDKDIREQKFPNGNLVWPGYKDGDVKPDDVLMSSVLGASKTVWTHEYRHRGMSQLKEYYNEDPAYFKEKYGEAASELLRWVSSERQTEAWDTPDEKFIATNSHTPKGVELSSGRYIQRKPLSEYLKGGKSGLEQAAKDLMSHRKNLLRDGYAEGGLVEGKEMASAVEKSVRPEHRPRTKTEERTLRGRPVWADEEGNRFSEVSKTLSWGGGWAIVPSIDEYGREKSEDELYDFYNRLGMAKPVDPITGESLRVFSDKDEAQAYAEWRSDTMFDENAVREGWHWDAEKEQKQDDPDKPPRTIGRELLGIGKKGLQLLGKKTGTWTQKTDGYSDGGLIEETQMALDPMSGNEIPAGGTAEGVRDDIQINVSEGEYVIPEHVVSYIGISRLEEMVEKASAGLEGMEANGRTGSDPEDLMMELEGSFAEGGLVGGVDLDSLLTKVHSAIQADPDLRSDLQTRGISFAAGGAVAPFQPNLYTPPGSTYFNTPAAGSLPTTTSPTSPIASTDVRVYTNQAGQKVSITFTNGQPTTPIPAGYFPEGSGFGGEGADAPELGDPMDVYRGMTDEQLNDIVSGKEGGKLSGFFDSLFGKEGFLSGSPLGKGFQWAAKNHTTNAQNILTERETTKKDPKTNPTNNTKPVVVNTPTANTVRPNYRPVPSKPEGFTAGDQYGWDAPDVTAGLTAPSTSSGRAYSGSPTGKSDPGRGYSSSFAGQSDDKSDSGSFTGGMKRGGLIKRKTKY